VCAFLAGSFHSGCHAAQALYHVLHFTHIAVCLWLDMCVHVCAFLAGSLHSGCHAAQALCHVPILA
jgi:hypothetical protein